MKAKEFASTFRCRHCKKTRKKIRQFSSIGKIVKTYCWHCYKFTDLKVQRR